jgi:uroporphyrinogen decarboxylase
LADTVILYLNAQIAAGAQMVQLFDTWGGLLDEHGYRTFIQPYQKKVLDGLNRTQAPAVLYMNNGAHLLPAVLETTPDGLSVDDRTSLITLRNLANTSGQTALVLQGNLDPIAMLSRPEVLKPLVQANLKTGGNKNYIFNVGHGLIPQTPPDNVKRVVEWIRSGELTTV